MTIKEIQELIDFVAKSGLEEVNLETDQIKLSIKKNVPVSTEHFSALSDSEKKETSRMPSSIYPTKTIFNNPANTAVSDNLPQDDLLTIKSPMLGTFYRAASPDKPPFVEEGMKVLVGQTLCVIEAMKLFNEIEAEIEGTIVKILIEDESPVEYDQPLFVIKPKEKT
jgi:acetyl-CoA carboxylase biotin carboxyl carrier protein